MIDTAIYLLETLGPLGHHLANSTASDDGERLALELLPHELFPFPLALLHRDVCLGDSPDIDIVASLVAMVYQKEARGKEKRKFQS